MKMDQFVRKWLRAVSFTITPCVNSCWHCYADVKKGRDRFISLEDFEKVMIILTRLAERYSINLKELNPKFLFYNDLMTHPQWYDIVKIAKSYNYECDESENLTTNGFAIAKNLSNQDFLKKFRVFNPQNVQLTLHGMSDLHNRYVKRKGGFGDIVETANFLISEGIPIYWQYFFSNENIEEFYSVSRLLKDLYGGKTPDINLILGSYSGKMRENEILRPERSDFYNLDSRVKDEISLYCDGDVESFLSNYTTESNFMELFEKKCDKLPFNIFKYTLPKIGSDLKLYYTTMNTGHFGNIDDDNLEEILKENYIDEIDRFQLFLGSVNLGDLLERYIDRSDHKLHWGSSLTIKLILKIAKCEGWDREFKFSLFEK